VPRVGPLHHGHARFFAKAGVELPVTDVQRKYVFGTVLKQAVGKPARGRSDVEADAVGRVDAQILERSRELLAATRNEAPIFAADANLRLGANGRPGFVDGRVVDQHAAGPDQRLGATAALRQAVGQHALVEPLATATSHSEDGV